MKAIKVLFLCIYRKEGLQKFHLLLDACRSKRMHLEMNEILCHISKTLLVYAPKNPFNALPYLLQCLTFCESHPTFVTLHAKVTVLLSLFHVLIGAPVIAFERLQVCFYLHAYLFMSPQTYNLIFDVFFNIFRRRWHLLCSIVNLI